MEKEKMQWNPYLAPDTKISSRWIIKMEVKTSSN